jgi:osmotically-inducible protein OsmY
MGNKVASATDDAAVTTKVKAALLAEPGLRSMEIHVDTKDGVVTLTGSPDTAANRDRAVVIARNVAGVKDVVDQMASKS